MDGRKKPRTPAQIEANKKNLKPGTITSGEMAREYQRRGEESKRRKRSMAESMAYLLSLPLRGDETVEELQSLADSMKTDGKKKTQTNVTVAEAILLAQIKEALKGNVQAARFVRELMPDATATAQEDDGFLDALNGTAASDWEDGSDAD